MRKIFNKNKKEEAVEASPPEAPETPGEIKEIERLNSSSQTTEKESVPEVNYREIPVCMSQAQINNLVIENNIMLKQIISSMDDDD